jgi:hypothetical protein
MYTEEYKKAGDIYKAKTFRTIHLPLIRERLIMNGIRLLIKNKRA